MFSRQSISIICTRDRVDHFKEIELSLSLLEHSASDKLIQSRKAIAPIHWD